VSAREWREARRILAVRLDNLGDVLVTTPALHAIKATRPEVELTLLASPVGAQAGALNPDVDRVIVYEAPWMDPWHRLPRDLQREAAILAELRAGQFDGAIIFTSFRESSLPAAYLCYLADIPLRLAASTDGPGSLLTTRHRHPERPMHEVERGLDLVGAVGFATDECDLVLRVPDEARARVRRQASGDGRWGAGDGREGPLVVIHPGCSMPARTYPWELYAELADLLVARLGARLALTGTAEERELVARILARVRPETRAAATSFAGELPFADFCALIEAADLTITNNTGPMHVSAAVKTPVVALFALTNPPEQWGPWRVPHRLLYRDVPCRLCYSRVCPSQQECLRGVPLDEIVVAAAELLAETGESAAPNGHDVSLWHGSCRGAACCALPAGDGVGNRTGRSKQRPYTTQTDGNGEPSRAAAPDDHCAHPIPHPPSPIPHGWLAARNILAVRLDNMGDVVMLGPALRAVKETSPEARLTLLASRAGAQAAPLLPWVDDVIVWRALWQDLGDLPFDPKREGDFVALLAERGFDAALIFTSFSQTPHVAAYACYQAGIPLRAGASKEFAGATLTDAPPAAPDDLHQVERNLRLVERLGFRASDRRLAVRVPDAARAAVPDLLARAGLDPAAPFVLLHPGASAAARRYPPDRFGAVAAELMARGWPVLVTGVARETDLVQAVQAAAPGAGTLVGATALPEFAALIERAALVLCNNTLPMHLADALGTPAVVLFAGTDLEEAWGPRDTLSRLLRRPTPCRPCFRFACPLAAHPCLDLPPADVVAAALDLLPAARSAAGAPAPLALRGVG